MLLGLAAHPAGTHNHWLGTSAMYILWVVLEAPLLVFAIVSGEENLC